MDDATSAAVRKLRDAEKRGFVEQGLAAIRQTESRVFTQEALAAIRRTGTQGFAEQAVASLGRTDTRGLVQQALNQMRQNDWRQTLLKGTVQEQYQSLMLRTVSQESAQSAVQQLRDEFAGSDHAKNVLASLSASSADLSKMFDLPGVVSSSEYVQSLTRQAGQISAAIADTDWGVALAKQFAQDGLTDSFIDELIDYTADELENDGLAEDVWELAENVPAVTDDEAVAFLQLLLPIIRDLILQSPTKSASAMVVFGTMIFSIVSSNPEVGKLTAVAAATQLFANFTVSIYQRLQEQRENEN